MKIIKPLDAHVHLRTGEMANYVSPMSAKQFADLVVMPNTPTPITTVELALDYRKRLVFNDKSTNYLMMLYLTEATSKEEVNKVADNPLMLGFKLYPMNATTGSQNGIKDIKNVYPLFAEMERLGVPLLIHGEVTRDNVDIFDREKVFIEEVLTDIINKFPKLKITLEHITTRDAVMFVLENDIRASITAHHLMISRNAMFTKGDTTCMNPNHFCLPVPKKEYHRLSLVEAATSGNPKFFAGTDSAPHPGECKASACGCAGIFTGLNAIEIYTTVFEKQGKLNKLEDFLSIFGRIWYGIEIPDGEEKREKETITIERKKWTVPTILGEKGLTPFKAGEELEWKVQ